MKLGEIKQGDVIVFKDNAYVVCYFNVFDPVIGETGFDYVEGFNQKLWWAKEHWYHFHLTQDKLRHSEVWRHVDPSREMTGEAQTLIRVHQQNGTAYVDDLKALGFTRIHPGMLNIILKKLIG